MRELAEHPVLYELWAYWRTQREGLRLPARHDIDPAEIPALLPHLQFVERVEDGEFRYRLTGGAVVDGFGVNPAGKLIRDVLAPRASPWRAGTIPRCGPAAADLVAQPLQGRGRLEQIVTRIILPLAADGKAVNALLLGQVFEGLSTFRAPASIGASAPETIGASSANTRSALPRRLGSGAVSAQVRTEFALRALRRGAEVCYDRSVSFG